jgi:uncharacterized membrane-anchored protein
MPEHLQHGLSGASRFLHPAVSGIRKVPAIGAYFWIIKILTTAMGEVTSDFLVVQTRAIVAVALGGIGLVAALLVQLSVHRYVAWSYWLAVVMVAIFGTMVADVIHVGLGIPYLVTTAFFLVVLVVTFVAWYGTERTLSIHTIYTRRREAFYWATVMATFALGTAAGDMTASTVGLGFFASGVMFAVLIALPALAYRLFDLNAILAFWVAYVLTRPLGASFADWLGKAPALSGLGLGTGSVSLVLTAVIVILVGYLTVTRRDVEGEER